MNFLDLARRPRGGGGGHARLPARVPAPRPVVGRARSRDRGRRRARRRRCRRAALVAAADAAARVARVRRTARDGRAGRRLRASDRRSTNGWVAPARACRQGDRVAGAALGVVGVLALVWLLIPALASSPGWPAGAVRASAVARAIDDLAPPPPDAASTLGRLVGDQTFPEVFDTLTTPDAGDPPEGGVAPDVAARVVALGGEGGGRGVRPGPGRHRLRRRARPDRHERARRGGRAVDRRRDLRRPPAPRPGRRVRPAARPCRCSTSTAWASRHSDSVRACVDMRGSLFGHPGGGDLRESPMRIAEEIVAEGTDIWREASTERQRLRACGGRRARRFGCAGRRRARVGWSACSSRST